MSGQPKPGDIPARSPFMEGGVVSPNWIGFLLSVISSTPQYDEVHSPDTGAVYFGDSETDGSWRITRSGNDLVIQRRESGSWVTKSTISA